MKDVQITYKCDDLQGCDSLPEVQELIDGAIERYLNNIGHSYSGDGLLKICVERCQEERSHGRLMGDLRYLKVYAEGQEPCIVMVY